MDVRLGITSIVFKSLISPPKIYCLHDRIMLIKQYLKEILQICNIDNAFFLFSWMVKSKKSSRYIMHKFTFNISTLFFLSVAYVILYTLYITFSRFLSMFLPPIKEKIENVFVSLNAELHVY